MKVIPLLILTLLNLGLFSQKFAIVGDFRGSASCDTTNVSDLVKSWNPDFIVTTGDLSDPNCRPIDEEIGQYFSDYIFPYYGSYGSTATENRFLSCLGNHDQYGDGLNNYLNFFTLPGVERYYDTLIGNVHIFVLNSSGTEPDGPFYYSNQGMWLQEVMENSTATWQIVFFHHPPYTSGMHGNSTWMQWPFAEWGADAVFSGHDHEYEKLYVNGLFYFVAGIGGGDLRPFYTLSEYSIKRVDSIRGALLCNAYPDSLVIECLSETDSLLDKQVITQMFTTNELTKINKFSVWPNPFSNQTNIELENPFNNYCLVELFSITGKKVFATGTTWSKLIINRDNLPAGVYFLKVTNTKTQTIQSEKLVIDM